MNETIKGISKLLYERVTNLWHDSLQKMQEWIDENQPTQLNLFKKDKI